MQTCSNEKCTHYDKKIVDNCANETLCDIGGCENYLKSKTDDGAKLLCSDGLCAAQKEITDEINRLQSFIKEPSFSDEEKHTKDMCQAQIPAYKHCLELLVRIST